MLNFKKWVSATVASFLLAATFTVMPKVDAEETKTIADESIYDILVDRYYNATFENDFDTNPKDNTQFAGGDFKGIVDKITEINDLDFTIISLGSVFKTETYDGTMVTSYSEIEPHFGTSDELSQLIEAFEKRDMKVMVDFPLTNVSENHEWTGDSSKSDWIIGTSNGKVRWDLNNEDVQKALIDSVVQFVSTYNVGGIRITNLDVAETSFLNEMIDAIKEVNKDIYVISNNESDANFDAKYYEDTNSIFRNIYINVDIDSTDQLKYVDSYLNGDLPAQLMIDNLQTSRFVHDAEAFPPTRLKMALASVLLLPGVPVVQYGTEIAVNGEAGPDAHQIYNFKTDSELVEYIGDLQYLRNKSDTLRSGVFKLIKNEDGLLAFERKSDEETWVVVINNTGKTTRVDISAADVGEDKELRGMLNNEIVRGKDGMYHIVLDREVVEVFQVIDEQGLNMSYLIALGLVYVLFIGFIFALIKRGKRRRAAQ